MSSLFTSITASELAKLAGEYAHAMAEALDGLNKQYPNPLEITGEEAENLRKYSDQISGPTPHQLIPAFERLFCLTMAEQFVVIPDG